MIRLVQPWSLWVLVFLPLVLWRLRGLSPASGTRRTVAWLCLACALAGPELRWGDAPGALMLVLDLSASTARSLRAGIAIAQTLVQGLPAGTPVGVIGVAGEAALIRPLRTDPDRQEVAALLERSAAHPEQVLAAAARDATDLAAGLDLAGWTITAGQRGRVLLVTDGWETQGDAVRAARDLARRGVPVDTLTLVPPSDMDAAVDELDLPARVPIGVPFEVRAALRSTRPAQAAAALTQDGVAVARRDIAVDPAGAVVRFSVTPTSAGPHRYAVQVTVPEDAEPRNDRIEHLVQVSDRPRILWVGNAGHVPTAPGWELTVMDPADVGRGRAVDAYDALVLANVAADALPASFAAQIPGYVGRLGGGLLMLGGRQAFGPGGYRGTPIEDVLPVTLEPPAGNTREGLALVIVLDKSGSMAETFGPSTKIQAARQAVLAAGRLLEPGDQLGVLDFDAVPRWVLPVQPVPGQGALEAALSGVQPAGGTQILPALKAAADLLKGFPRVRRHIVLVTDGQGEGGDFTGTARRLAAGKISVSAVAVGEDADVRLLGALARAGGGRLELAGNADALAAAFRREVVAAHGRAIQEGATALVAAPHPVLDPAIRSYPPLYGYVATGAKASATVPLRSETGAPLLALAPFGLGRAAALTTDLGGPWAADWQRWRETPRLLSRVLGWILRTPPPETIAVRQEPDAEGWRLVVRATDAEGAYLDGRRLQAHVGEGSAQSLRLEQIGPGTYAAPLPSRLAQPTIVVVEDRTGEGRIVARAQVGDGYAEEYRIRGPNAALLDRIRELSGGRPLDVEHSRPVSVADAARWLPLWQALAWSGLALFLLDLLLARTRDVGGRTQSPSGAAVTSGAGSLA